MHVLVWVGVGCRGYLASALVTSLEQGLLAAGRRLPCRCAVQPAAQQQPAALPRPRLHCCLQAVADCSRAAALNPNYAKASSRLATLLSELGRHSDAAAALEAACAAKGVR